MKLVSTLAIASALVLSGCGGGGGGDSAVAAPKATPALAKYVGSWQICYPSGAKSTLSMTLSADESLDYKSVLEYFENNNCTGAVVATRTTNKTINITRTSAQDVSVALPPSTVASNISTDNVSVSISAGRVSYVGSGVTYDAANNLWCVKNNTGSSCESDKGIEAASVVTDRMYTNGATLYFITVSGTTAKVDSSYTKI